ncbi:hypothetical protein GT031_19460 [Streptomyces sp. SID2888]|nr:hypothetical protein [Streptomyces sp. SID2888]
MGLDGASPGGVGDQDARPAPDHKAGDQGLPDAPLRRRLCRARADRRRPRGPQGVRVCVVDSGVDPDHPLAGSYAVDDAGHRPRPTVVRYPNALRRRLAGSMRRVRCART